MEKVAVFVDAGYLFASGSVLLMGEKLTRGELYLDHEQVLTALKDLAERVTGARLLRIYWYDGTSSGPTAQQLSLAYCRNLKLRLGFVNTAGQQKGVDSLIVTDMITLARNRAMDYAVLLSGDEDVRVGVQQAQEWGVRVHLLGIAPATTNQSAFLVQEADDVHEFSAADVAGFLSRTIHRTIVAENADVAGLPGEPGGEVLMEVGATVAAQLPPDEMRAILRNASTTTNWAPIPPEVDRHLLRAAGDRLGRRLDSDDKKEVRRVFVQACRDISSQRDGEPSTNEPASPN